MAQGILPFKHETEKNTTGMTALAGLPVYLDLARVIGLSKSIEKHLKVRKGGQGWTDSQIILSLVLLNLAGGDCVDDIKTLEADDGFCEVLKKAEMHDLRRQEKQRQQGKAFIPTPNKHLQGFAEINKDLAAFSSFQNTAWGWIMILALNLNAMMKKLAMEGSWLSKRMKAVRFFLLIFLDVW